MDLSLKGKVALVTGGSRGIGAAIARQLAAQGAEVAITYGKSAAAAEALAKEISAKGGRARAYAADALQVEKLGDVVKAVARDFGKIDILVNNAGVFEGAPVGEQTFEQYAHVMGVNVAAVFATTNAAVKVMPDGGRIINIGSVAGEAALFAGNSLYTASKFAVSGFSRGWALDLAPRAITVNCIEPGPINTEMNPNDDGEMATAMRAQTPLKRYGEPEEVANLAGFLASGAASYITGACVNISGGWLA